MFWFVVGRVYPTGALHLKCHAGGPHPDPLPGGEGELLGDILSETIHYCTRIIFAGISDRKSFNNISALSQCAGGIFKVTCIS